MLLYTGYYEAEEMKVGENPPVGILLCSNKNETVVRYTLGGTNQNVFAARYQLHLPTEDELRSVIEQQRDTAAAHFEVETKQEDLTETANVA